MKEGSCKEGGGRGEGPSGEKADGSKLPARMKSLNMIMCSDRKFGNGIPLGQTRGVGVRGCLRG